MFGRPHPALDSPGFRFCASVALHASPCDVYGMGIYGRREVCPKASHGAWSKWLKRASPPRDEVKRNIARVHAHDPLRRNNRRSRIYL